MIGELEPEFEAFVVESSPRLLRFAFLFTGDRGHAEDLLQTALLRTVRRWRTARASPEAYAHRVLTNLAHDRWRWLRRRPAESTLEEWVDVPVDGAAQQIVDRQVLWRMTRELPAQQRAVLVLRFWEDLSVDDTAATLGCTAGTVKSHTNRALRTLRALLGGHGDVGLAAIRFADEPPQLSPVTGAGRTGEG